jgi:hypothetical protein
VAEVAFQECQPLLICDVINTDRDSKAIYGQRQGVVMKNSLFITILALLQGACSTTKAAPATSQSILTFDQIALEISVQHEVLEPDTSLASTTARNVLTTR